MMNKFKRLFRGKKQYNQIKGLFAGKERPTDIEAGWAKFKELNDRQLQEVKKTNDK
jgi:hypothetical protein